MPRMTKFVSSEVPAKDQDPSSVKTADVILAQLTRILESPPFRNSKRYSRFLRFIIEQQLAGQANLLKERTLGIEVFERAPDYDPATDAIVRVAAGEIRKRLAQYYVEYGHECELRIQVQPGSYVPEFHWPPTSAVSDLAPLPTEPVPIPLIDIPPNRPTGHSNKKGTISIGAAFVLVVVMCSSLWVSLSTPVHEFWKPFLTSASLPLICIGNQGAYLPNGGTSEPPGLRTGINSHDLVALADVEAFNRISEILARHGQRPQVKNASSTTFAELRQQPVVLISGSTNQWTMRSMHFLRFQLVRDFSPGVNVIIDQQDPSRPRWMVDFNAPFSSIQREYAIIARFYDPTIGHPSMIAAGLGANGTVAAADFMITPAYLREFTDKAPRGWEDRNVEIILETQMINGDYGPPHVVATYYW